VSSSCERVDHEREADEVEVLALVAEAAGASEPEAVVESPVEACEVGVVGGYGPDVLGAVELAASRSMIRRARRYEARNTARSSRPATATHRSRQRCDQ
jgi:hypothetical protein